MIATLSNEVMISLSGKSDQGANCSPILQLPQILVLLGKIGITNRGVNAGKYPLISYYTANWVRVGYARICGFIICKLRSILT